jgi:hypothetical protein
VVYYIDTMSFVIDRSVRQLPHGGGLRLGRNEGALLLADHLRPYQPAVSSTNRTQVHGRRPDSHALVLPAQLLPGSVSIVHTSL